MDVRMWRSEWLVDVKTMADRIITMRHKLKEGLAKEGTVSKPSTNKSFSW
jgi:hypothetical protein